MVFSPPQLILFTVYIKISGSWRAVVFLEGHLCALNGPSLTVTIKILHPALPLLSFIPNCVLTPLVDGLCLVKWGLSVPVERCCTHCSRESGGTQGLQCYFCGWLSPRVCLSPPSFTSSPEHTECHMGSRSTPVLNRRHRLKASILWSPLGSSHACVEFHLWFACGHEL